MASLSNSGRLLGKVSVITASTDGIGFAIAKRFLEEGSKVVVSSRKQDNVDKAVEQLENFAQKSGVSTKENLLGLVCHVDKAEHRRNLVAKTVERFGSLNVLVSNAAVSPTFGSICDVDEKAFAKIMQTNVQSSFLLCKEALPYLKQSSNPSILFVSSFGGYVPISGIGAYCVSKTSLLGLTKTLASELAQFNIRVNCLAPGLIKTKFSQPFTEDPQTSEQILRMIPMRRFGEVGEMAGPALFLCSDDASYITGETLVAGGGIYAHL